MPTRIVGVDTLDPKLPDVVVEATRAADQLQRFDVRNYGASTAAAGASNRVAIQAAIDDAALVGGVVFIPPGEYVLDGTTFGHIVLKSHSHIVGTGRGITKLVQLKSNSAAIDGDSISDWTVANLSIEKDVTTATPRGINIRGDGDVGAISNVTISNGGLYITGEDPTWSSASPQPTVKGRQRNVIIDRVWVSGSDEYGINLQSVLGVDVIAPQIDGSAIDGLKFQYACDDVTITGGYSRDNGQEGMDAFMGGTNFSVVGLKCEGNTGNGITFKSDENIVSPSDQMPAGRANLVGVICRGNTGSGLTLNRSGNTDNTALPLMSHISVSGGQFNDNGGYGILLRARNCTLTGPAVRRNGQDGILVDAGAMDCDIVSPQVSGNGRAAGTWDGIKLSGTRNRIIGGYSIGKDDLTDDTITADADYAALTATQRWGLLIVSGSTDCEAHNVTTLYNLTGGQTSSAASGMIRSRTALDVRDASTARTIALTVDGLAGKLTAGTAVDLVKVSGVGAFSIGHASLASASMLGPAGGWHCFPKFTAGAELEIDGALNHDGTTVGFYGATPVTKAASPGTAAGTDAAVINAIITALRNLGLVT